MLLYIQVINSIMKRRDIFEKSNNSNNNDAAIQNLKNELIELVNQNNYSKDLKEYILLALEYDEVVQSTIDFLKENKTLTESEVIDKIFDVVSPYLIYYVDNNKEKFYQNKIFYLKNYYKLFDEKGNVANEIERKWLFDFLFNCTSDVQWDTIAFVNIEMRELISYFRQYGNKMQEIIFDTDNLEDIIKYKGVNNSFLMIYSQESEIHSILNGSVMTRENCPNVCWFCIIIKDDLPKKYQIGIMHPMKKGDKNDK